MSVSFHPNGLASASHLIPTPFVSVGKTFDKSGSGEILGVRYAITLTGTIVYDRGSPNSSGNFSSSDATETIAANAEYASIQAKQKAIMNLFSKKNEGGLLHVDNPKAGSLGFKCYPRIISVDMPTHDPGRPTMAAYTIVLEADKLVGPTGVVNDEDDWERLNKWLVSSASESWTINENEGGKAITMASGPITKVEKTYTLTRNISATGKGKFDDNTDAADGFKGDNFSTKYVEDVVTSSGGSEPTYTTVAKNGQAWQQARGFVYDILKYGNVFLVGEQANSTNTMDANGINLPDGYDGYNYVRSETVDELGGTFSATESWILLPDGHNKVTETVESSLSQSQDTGIIKVSINGTIQGVGTQNKDATLPGTEAADTTVDFEEKYANATARLTGIEGKLYLTAQDLLRDNAAHSTTVLNPAPLSKTVGRNPYTGTITYSLEFDNRPTFAIPGVRSETIAVNDTYPGYVAATTQVIGRALGPVLQSIGTQTVWERSLSISCVVGVSSTGTCAGAKDSGGNLLDPQPDNEADCDAADDGTWTGDDLNPLGDPKTDHYAGAIAAKPSHVQTQREAIIKIIDQFNPAKAGTHDGTPTGTPLINVFFTKSPSETWNPRTGAWTFDVSWTYEPYETYQFMALGTPQTKPAAPYPKTFI